MSTTGGFVAVGVLSTALLTNPSPGLAQSCEALPVDGSPMRYRYRADPPRCEGIYRSPVSGNPGMTLVSLTYGGVTYDPGRDQDLEISLPVEPAERTLIRGVGVPERLYYRLDAELDANHSAFRLPLADVITRDRQLVPEALGLYGYRMLPDGQTAFVPVSARSSGEADRTRVVAVVRPGSDVYDAEWRQYPPGGTPTDWVPVASATGLAPEGSRLEIVLQPLAPQTILEVSYLVNGAPGADHFLLLDR
jgi:hypothetical protein